jgi:pilus assembly protein CpaB
MRATAVRSNEIVGVAGFLFPGSHVDVLVTYNAPNGVGTVTQTVLQNVEVLTTGTATEPDPQGKPQTVSVVTLLLSPEDSQKLLLSSNQGTIQFVLRSGVDQEKVKVYPTRLEQLLVGDKPPAPPVAAKPAPKPAPRKPDPPKAVEPPKPVAPPPVVVEPPKPQIHRLEIIQGTQRSTREFTN